MEEPSVHLTCPWAMKWTGTVAQLEFGSNSAIKLFTWQNAEFNNNNFRSEFKPLFEYSQNIVLIFINVRNVLLHNNYSRISDAKTSCCRNLEKTWQYIRSGMLRSYLVQKKIKPRPFSKLDYLIVPHQFSFRNGCISNDLLLFTQYYISKVNCLMSKLIQTLSSVMRNIQMLK